MATTTVKEREILLTFQIWADDTRCGWRCAHLNEGGGDAFCNLSFDKEMETEGYVDKNVCLKRSNDRSNRWLRTPRCIQAEKELVVYRKPRETGFNNQYIRAVVYPDAPNGKIPVVDINVNGYALVKPHVKEELTAVIKLADDGEILPKEIQSRLDEIIIRAERERALIPLGTKQRGFVSLEGVTKLKNKNNGEKDSIEE